MASPFRYLLPLFLAFSLAANAYLFLRPADHSAQISKPPAANPATPAETSSRPIQLPTDPAELKLALEKIGLPAELITQIQGIHAFNSIIARMEKLTPSRDPNLPYWKTQKRPIQTTEQRLEERKLWREYESSILQLTAGSTTGPLGFFGGREKRYGFLPEEKRSALKRIEDDYRELSDTINSETNNFPLKSDIEKLKFISAEKQRDIDALLSSEEKITLERSSSPAANSVRRRYGEIVASEEEFLALYELQKKFESTYPGLRSNHDKTVYAAAEKQLRADMDALIGPERLALHASQNPTDPDLRLLEAASRRVTLPANSTEAIVALRTQTATQAQSIAADSKLTPEERIAAYKALGGQAQTQLIQTLGPEVGETFAQRGADWIKFLKQGTSFTLEPGGHPQPVDPAKKQ